MRVMELYEVYVLYRKGTQLRTAHLECNKP